MQCALSRARGVDAKQTKFQPPSAAFFLTFFSHLAQLDDIGEGGDDSRNGLGRCGCSCPRLNHLRISSFYSNWCCISVRPRPPVRPSHLRTQETLSSALTFVSHSSSTLSTSFSSSSAALDKRFLRRRHRCSSSTREDDFELSL